MQNMIDGIQFQMINKGVIKGCVSKGSKMMSIVRQIEYDSS